jgi:dihydroflavonol-4-reductase
MKCLVLGATGIIGYHIVRELLERGHEVSALSRGIKPAVNLEGLDVRRITADLGDADALKGAFREQDWVFYAAGYYPGHAFGMEGHVRAASAQAQNVIEAALAAGIKKLIYTSSLTTIGKALDGKIADETCAYDLSGRDPHPYFRVKHVLEGMFSQAVREGLSVVMVNPTGCFGPFELKDRNLCLIPQLKLGKIPGYVERPINVVDTADVARGHVLAAERGRTGERYILGAHNTTTGTMMREICDAIGAKPPHVKFPLPLALAVAYASEAVAVPFGSTPLIPVLGVRFIQYGRHLSSAKAERELGYKPGPMRPCFERALGWYQKIGYC